MELFTPGHLVVLLVIAGVLFFGWKQLPDMARSAGRSLHVFRSEINGMNESVKAATAEVRETAQAIKEQPHVVPATAAESPAIRDDASTE